MVAKMPGVNAKDYGNFRLTNIIAYTTQTKPVIE